MEYRLKNGITIVYDEGYAIDKNCAVTINSANNGLLFGGSGALAIKDATGPRVENDVCSDPQLIKEFQEMYARLLPMGDRIGKWVGEVCKEWIKGDYKLNEKGKRKSQVKETYAQLECLKAIAAREGVPYELGDAVLTLNPQPIIHAVGMGYTFDKVEVDEKGNKKFRKGERIPADGESVRKALQSALDIVADKGYASLALPLMCVRDGYSGADVARACQEHNDITLQVLGENVSRTKLERIVYCADNSESKAFFRERGRIL